MKAPSIPLDELRLDWASHWAALRLLDSVFRRPRDLKAAVLTTSNAGLRRGLLQLGLHGVPYFILLVTAVRYLMVEVTGPLSPTASGLGKTHAHALLAGVTLYLATLAGVALTRVSSTYSWMAWVLPPLGAFLTFRVLPDSSIAAGIATGIGIGSFLGIAAGTLGAIAAGIATGIIYGLLTGTFFGIPGGVIVVFWSSVALAIILGIVLGIISGTVEGIPSRRLGGTAQGLASATTSMGIVGGTALAIFFGVAGTKTIGSNFGIASGLTSGIAFMVMYYRPVYIPGHLWKLIRPHSGNPYQNHPLLNDQCIALPLPFLDRLLIRYYENSPAEANKEIDRLIDTYWSQRTAALRARTIIIIRSAATIEDLAKLDSALDPLPIGTEGFLAETEKARDLAHEISIAAWRLNQASRGYLRRPYAELLVAKVDIFHGRISGLEPPLSTELRKAAENWKHIAVDRMEQEKYLIPGGRFQAVFRPGDAIKREIDAYVPRRGLLVDLEEQIHMASTSSGMVLVGRRRTGKSTLLENLEAQVRPKADVAVIAMQSAQAFTSVESFQTLVHSELAAKLPAIPPPAAGSDLRGFEALLAAADRELERTGRKLILAIDEYEAIDAKIAAGVFPEDLLALLRQSMRSHRRIFWIFAGSRSIEDLTGARWTSYFIGTRLLEMPLFELAETRELLTEPMRHSDLFQDSETRPRFASEFWGHEGIEKLHEEAGGWPYLIQLLAFHAVQLVNQEGRNGVDADLFERVCTKACTEGSIVFTELLEKESRLEGEWSYLLGFRRKEEQEPPGDTMVDRALRRRWLITETTEGNYRLRVPLMRRWLRQWG